MMRWYVMQAKPQKEQFVYEQLGVHEIEASYPSIQVKFVKPGARKVRPYFPGYLFVHVDLHTVGVSILKWIPGAVGLVCFGGEPAWVSDGIVQAIRERVDQINTTGAESLRNLKAGDDIAVHSGPLAGYRGIFASYLSDCERVIVFLKFIHDQQIRVELPVIQISSLKRRQAYL